LLPLSYIIAATTGEVPLRKEKMKKLQTQHQAVAANLARGLPLERVLEFLGIPSSSDSLKRWKRISADPLFKDEVRRMQERFENSLVQDEIRDPVYYSMKTAAREAAELLRTELSNDGEGANAGSRIKAATSILDRTGYSGRDESGKAGTNIIVALAGSQVEHMERVSRPTDQPEVIKRS